MWTTFVEDDVNKLIEIFNECGVKSEQPESEADEEPSAASFLASQAKGDRSSWSDVAQKIVNGLAATRTRKDTVGESEKTAADTTSSVTLERSLSPGLVEES